MKVALAAALAAITLAFGACTSLSPPAAPPTYQVDTSWPKLPNNWVMGQVSAVVVDSKDHLWLLHRPRTVPEAQRANAAPPVIELDANGGFVQAWGGQGEGFEWPNSEHLLEVSDSNVWIAGNTTTTTGGRAGATDDMLLKFTRTGKFVSQFGHRGANNGNADTGNLNAPADAFFDKSTNELYIADGYGNNRVIVLDAGAMTFKRMWGAFGNVPATPDFDKPLDRTGAGDNQFAIVHGVTMSKDRLVYVADRANQRIQVFKPDGSYLNQVFINRDSPPSLRGAGAFARPQTAVTLALSKDPGEKYLFVGDYGNSELLILDRRSLATLSRFGKRDAAPGDFQGIHDIAVDSRGNLYTAEVAPGSRAQKFIPQR